MRIVDMPFEAATRLLGVELHAAKLGEMITHPDAIPHAERCLTPLHEAFYGNTGPLVHKWRHYLAIYY